MRKSVAKLLHRAAPQFRKHITRQKRKGKWVEVPIDSRRLLKRVWNETPRPQRAALRKKLEGMVG